jgi:SAM-dependent methyltransferase
MTDNHSSLKENVRHFYDRVGWQLEEGEHYQNAQYEDLRPVAREYIHRCHLRVNRHLAPQGKYLLDAGSGPIQYPEYLTYSEGYQYRVCADISIVALQEARKRIGAKGLMVVSDVAHLPFKKDAFDGVVSLHTFHHLPMDDQMRAYDEVYRVLAPDRSAVIVNGWTDAPLMHKWGKLARGMDRLQGFWRRLTTRREVLLEEAKPDAQTVPLEKEKPAGTFVEKYNAAWLREHLQGRMNFEILVWRSISVPFMRSVFHGLPGKLALRWLYAAEEKRPQYYGENGQYPLVVVRK